MKKFNLGKNHIFTDRGGSGIIYMGAGANETLSFSGLVNFESVNFSGVPQTNKQYIGNRFSSTTISDISNVVPHTGAVLTFNSTTGFWGPSVSSVGPTTQPKIGYEDAMWGLLIGFNSSVSGATRACLSEVKFSGVVYGTTTQFSGIDLDYISGSLPSDANLYHDTILDNSSYPARRPFIYWTASENTLDRTLKVFKNGAGFLSSPSRVYIAAYNSSKSVFESSLDTHFTSTWSPTGLTVQYIYGNYLTRNLNTLRQNVHFTTTEQSDFTAGIEPDFYARQFLDDATYLSRRMSVAVPTAGMSTLSLRKPNRYLYVAALGLSDGWSDSLPINKRSWFADNQTIRFSGLNFQDSNGGILGSGDLGATTTWKGNGVSDSISGTVNATSANLFDSNDSTYFGIGHVQDNWLRVDFSSTNLIFVGSVECRIATFSDVSYNPRYRIGLDTAMSRTVEQTSTITNTGRQDALGTYVTKTGEYNIRQMFLEQERVCGVTFSSSTKSGGQSDSIFDIAYSPSLALFVAVGSRAIGSGFLQTSTDGINWTVIFTVAFALTGVAWSPTLNLFLVTSTFTSAFVSPDGSTWASRTVGALGGFPRVKWESALGAFIISSSSTFYTRTTDTVNFTSTVITATGLTSSGWIDSAATAGTIVMASRDATFGLVYSVNGGVTFTSTTGISTRKFSSVATNGSVFVAAVNGSNSEIYTSDNGIAWTSISVVIDTKTPSGLHLRFATVKYFSDIGLFIHKAADSLMLASPDGYNWYSFDTPFSNPESTDGLGHAFGGFEYGHTKGLVLGASENKTAFAPNRVTVATSTFQPILVTNKGEISTLSAKTPFGTEATCNVHLNKGDFITTLFFTTHGESLSLSGNYVALDYISVVPSTVTYNSLELFSSSPMIDSNLQVMTFSAYGPGFFGNTTNSTSNTTGSVRTLGGLGVSQDVHIGGSTTSSSSSTGALVVSGAGAGGVGVGGNLFVGGTVNGGGISRFTNGTGSTSTTTGAVVITGGCGVSEHLFCSGLRANADIVSTSSTTGAIRTQGNGGIGCAGAFNAGGAIRSYNTGIASIQGNGGLQIAAGGYIGTFLELGIAYPHRFDCMKRIHATGSQSITAATLTDITWNTTVKSSDSAGLLPTLSSATYTVIRSGWYTLACGVTFGTIRNQTIDLSIVTSTNFRIRTNSQCEDSQVVCGQVFLAAAGTFKAQVRVITTTSLSNTTGYQPWITMHLHPNYSDA